MKKINIILFLVLLCLCNACREKEILPTDNKLTIAFNHHVDKQNIDLDNKFYTNVSGNEYMISEIKYFVSNICLYKNGEHYNIPDIHYIDITYPSSLFFTTPTKWESGLYDSLSFIFGITDAENTTNRFVNFPENTMSWPVILGGGYHYMMINGKYKENDTLKAMNIHLGRGQIYIGTTHATDSIVGFVDNSFKVCLPLKQVLFENTKDTIFIEMNINNWFANPFNFNIAYFGSHIMQNQTAMQMLKSNGEIDVFTIKN